MGILKKLLDTVSAYSPTEWATGDIITAEKLNNIEHGINENNESIADYFFISFTNIESDDCACNKTLEEIEAAFTDGKKLVAVAVLETVGYTAIEYFTDVYIYPDHCTFDLSYSYKDGANVSTVVRTIAINATGVYISRIEKFTSAATYTKTDFIT